MVQVGGVGKSDDGEGRWMAQPNSALFCSNIIDVGPIELDRLLCRNIDTKKLRRRWAKQGGTVRAEIVSRDS